jgi:hypothetical protein
MTDEEIIGNALNNMINNEKRLGQYASNEIRIQEIIKEALRLQREEFEKRSLYCCDCKKNFALICGECNKKEISSLKNQIEALDEVCFEQKDKLKECLFNRNLDDAMHTKELKKALLDTLKEIYQECDVSDVFFVLKSEIAKLEEKR